MCRSQKPKNRLKISVFDLIKYNIIYLGSRQSFLKPGVIKIILSIDLESMYLLEITV